MNKGEILEQMYHQYQDCDRCESLCAGRENVVFGAGKITAPLMLIGGGPDQQDEKWEHPFVKSSEDILASALKRAKLSYKVPTRGTPGQYDVYVTNTVLCRPFSMEQGKTSEYKKQRPPTVEEIENCRERLFEEIYTIDPKLIILMGPSALTMVTHLTLSNVSGHLFYLKIPGKTEGVELTYPALVTWSPHELAEGREHEKPGSDREKFNKTILHAASMIRASQAYSEELLV